MIQDPVVLDGLLVYIKHHYCHKSVTLLRLYFQFLEFLCRDENVHAVLVDCMISIDEA